MKPLVELSARDAFRWVVVVGFLAVLGANLPGHLSYDSMAQLHEGHMRSRETWGPVLYAWLLGTFDRLIPGASLAVVASCLVLFASLASTADLRPRVSWLAPPVAALVILSPQVMIYSGIVWKDVMAATAAVGAMVCLAHAAGAWTDHRRRWLGLAGALVLLAAAAQLRQNGVVVGILAAVAVGWVAAQGRWRRGLAWGVGFLVAVVAAAQLMTALTAPPDMGRDRGLGQGLRILQHYDLVGAVSLDPTYDLAVLRRIDPVRAQVVRTRGPLTYSGERVDFSSRDPQLGAALVKFRDPAVTDQWLDLILNHPVLYARVRWEAFRWLVTPPAPERCLPVHTGVNAPVELMQPLGMSVRQTQADKELFNYVTWFVGTPAWSHVAYAALALLLAGLFLRRREAADIPMAALQLAGVGFGASFFVISIACDYRYLYFTDLAALTGLVYAAVDPPFGRARRS